MKYKIQTTEVELWDREYLVEADSKEEAEKLLKQGEFIYCLEETCDDSIIKTTNIDEVYDEV